MSLPLFYGIILSIEKVVMKRDKFFLFLGVALSIIAGVFVGVSFGSAAEDSDSSEFQMYTKPSVSNMDLAGTTRGNWHDREDLGIYMKAGASFDIRIKNTNEFKKNVVLDVYNDDSQTEKRIELKPDGNFTKVTADVDSVPFVRTVYGTKVGAILEIKDKTNTSKLIKYSYGENEENFLNTWKNSDDKFAVVEGDSVTMLVPRKNINSLSSKNAGPYGFKTIDEMLKYYDDFTAQYDKFLGLEYNASDPLNNNVKTKYFIKADKHGAGAAYYNGNHTAQNGDNISGYLSRGWLNLHEFGHGYQGTIAHQELSLGEVTNNVLGYYFQQTFLQPNDAGWMGEKINIEKQMKNRRDSVSNFNQLNEREKLYMLVNLLDKLGPEKTWAQMNIDYRKMRSEGKNISTSDLFAIEFSKSGYNVIPYLNANKIFVSSSVASEIYAKDLPIIGYLRDFVASDEKSNSIRSDLGLASNYDLVSSDELAKFNLSGNVKITFDIDNFDEIKNKEVSIMNGGEAVRSFTINSKTINLSGLPVGVYSIKIPLADDAYDHDFETITISENSTTNKTIKYTKISESPFATADQISLRGLGDAEFAKVKFENGKVCLVANAVQPHSYFSDEYANVRFYKKDGTKFYEKSFVGNKNIGAINDCFDFEIGDRVSIKHREASSRLVFINTLLNKNDDTLKTDNKTDFSDYEITKKGLKKVGISSEGFYENYKKKLDEYIQDVRSSIPKEYLSDTSKYFKERNNIKAAISELNESDKEKYLDANKDLIGEVNPEKNHDGKYVTYEDFGAKADGTYDDFIAIRKTHEYANKHNLPVKARANKTYHIFNFDGDPASIMTDTDFNGSTFIIHDEDIENKANKDKYLFTITSNYKDILDLDNPSFSVDKNTKKISGIKSYLTTLNNKGYNKYLVLLEDANEKQYIRYGENANSGDPKTEMFVVDKNGTISDDVVNGFSAITHAKIFPISNKKLTIKNGNFITKVSEQKAGDSRPDYVHRSFYFWGASNVDIENISHKLNPDVQTNEYDGFLNFKYSSFITLNNVSFFSHKKRNSSWSNYDLRLDRSTNINISNLDSNDINDDSRWGIMESEYCKDLNFENVKMNRIDAHQGLTDLNVNGSEIGYYGFTLTGNGKIEIKNSSVNSESFINLRGDYGSTWNGNVRVLNSTHKYNNRGSFSFLKYDIFLDGDNVHNFGYSLRQPNIYLENFVIDANGSSAKNYDLIPDNKSLDKAEREYFPETFEIRNYKIINGNPTVKTNDKIRTKFIISGNGKAPEQPSKDNSSKPDAGKKSDEPNKDSDNSKDPGTGKNPNNNKDTGPSKNSSGSKKFNSEKNVNDSKNSSNNPTSNNLNKTINSNTKNNSVTSKNKTTKGKNNKSSNGVKITSGYAVNGSDNSKNAESSSNAKTSSSSSKTNAVSSNNSTDQDNPQMSGEIKDVNSKDDNSSDDSENGSDKTSENNSTSANENYILKYGWVAVPFLIVISGTLLFRKKK